MRPEAADVATRNVVDDAEVTGKPHDGERNLEARTRTATSVVLPLDDDGVDLGTTPRSGCVRQSARR